MRRDLEKRRVENDPVCPSGTEGTRAGLAARAKAHIIHTPAWYKKMGPNGKRSIKQQRILS